VLPGPQPDAPRYGCYEESNKEWSIYGPDLAWTLRTNVAASGGQYYEGTAWENTYAEFHFAATGFSLVYHTAPDGGQADIYVDGNPVPVTTLNMVSDPEQWLNQYTYSGPALNPNVVHVVRVVQAGSGNIYLDRIDLPSYFGSSCP
jgi:hypothetical protein